MSLSMFIVRDLERRLTDEAELPSRLTLASLAKIYGVSLTPVREAVSSLINCGVLRRTATGRLLRGNARPKGHELDTAHQPPDWDRFITQQVLVMSLRGQGTPLREETLARQWSVGRTVLRQVFHRLAGAGIIQYLPRRGWRVRAFRDDDLRQYLEIRVNLELQALTLAWPRLDRAVIAQMLHGNRPLSSNSGPRLDNRLHQYFIQTAGNRYIIDFFDRYGGYYGELFDYATLGVDVICEMAEQHCQILRAVLENRPVEARQELEHHIWSQEPVVRQMMRRLEQTGAGDLAQLDAAAAGRSVCATE